METYFIYHDKKFDSVFMKDYNFQMDHEGLILSISIRQPQFECDIENLRNIIIMDGHFSNVFDIGNVKSIHVDNPMPITTFTNFNKYNSFGSNFPDIDLELFCLQYRSLSKSQLYDCFVDGENLIPFIPTPKKIDDMLRMNKDF